MVEYILMGSMAIVIVALFLLRTHTAIVFLALCAGSVLVQTTGADLGLVASSLSSGFSFSTDIARLIALLVPALVCALFLRGYLSRPKSFLGMIPGIATAMLGAMMVVPLLSKGVQGSVGATGAWELLQQYQEFIVAVGLVISIGMIAATVRKAAHEKEPHKKGHH